MARNKRKATNVLKFLGRSPNLWVSGNQFDSLLSFFKEVIGSLGGECPQKKFVCFQRLISKALRNYDFFFHSLISVLKSCMLIISSLSASAIAFSKSCTCWVVS